MTVVLLWTNLIVARLAFVVFFNVEGDSDDPCLIRGHVMSAATSCCSSTKKQ